MSRGLGKLQRELLTILRKHARSAPSAQAAAMGLDTLELTSRLYYGVPSWRYLGTPEKVTVRKALAGLARRGLVVRLGTMLPGARVCRWHVGLW